MRTVVSYLSFVFIYISDSITILNVKINKTISYKKYKIEVENGRVEVNTVTEKNSNEMVKVHKSHAIENTNKEEVNSVTSKRKKEYDEENDNMQLKVSENMQWK